MTLSATLEPTWTTVLVIFAVFYGSAGLIVVIGLVLDKSEIGRTINRFVRTAFGQLFAMAYIGLAAFGSVYACTHPDQFCPNKYMDCR